MPTADRRVGRAIAQARISADMSQAELAARLSCGQGTVSKWENGAPITVSALMALAAVLRVPAWYLVALAELEGEEGSQPGMLATARALLARPIGDTIR